MQFVQKIKQAGSLIFHSEKFSKKTIVFLIIFIYLPIFSINALHHIKPKPLSGGSRQYFFLAYNMLHHGAYSMNIKDSPNLTPSSYRPPGYSTFLAICLAIIPDFQEITLKDIVRQDERGKAIVHSKDNSGFMKIKYFEAFLHLLISLIAMWLTWKITGKYYAAILVLLWVGFHPKLSSSVNTLHSEILQSFLATLFSLLLYYIVEKKNIMLFAISGLLLGCLALTRGTWYYFWLPALLIFFYLAWRFPYERKTIITGICLFMTCFVLIVGGWMARNYFHFERAFLSERGGVALDIRMNINMMTWQEYKASFLVWSKSEYLSKTALKKLFKPEEYERIVRTNPNSFYQTARTRRGELNEIYSPQLADKIQLNEAVDKLFHHPFRSIFSTIPITYRGIQKIAHQEAICVLILLLSAFAFIRAALKKNVGAVAVLFPAGIMFMFNCFLTHNLPRFNLPYVPVFLIAALLGIEYIWIWYRR